MCGSSGGKKEREQIRRDELEEESRIDRDLAELNAIFGITGYDYADIAQPEIGVEMELRRGGPGINDGEYDYITRTEYMTPEEIASLAAEAEDPERADYLSGLISDWDYDAEALEAKAAENAAARDETLWGSEGVYNTILDKYTNEIDDQRGRRESDIRLALARSGMVGTDYEASLYGELNEAFDEAIAEYTGKANSAVKGIESADQRIRNQLRGDIEAGGSLDSEYAINALDDSLRTSQQTALDATLDNLFAGLADLYGQRRDVDAYNRGYYDSRGIGAPSSSEYSGETIDY